MENDGEQQVAPPSWSPSQAEVRAGARIRALRAARGWSQAELGRRLDPFEMGMSQVTVSKLEGATRPIRVTELVGIARALGVTPDDLLADEGTAAVPVVAAAREELTNLQLRVPGAKARAERAQELADEALANYTRLTDMVASAERNLAELLAEDQA